MPDWRLIEGDCLSILPTLAPGSVQCCVTSPPYYGLRDYGVAGQLGLEASPDAYVARMVAMFRGVRRVLRDDGTLWLNLGDSYNGGGGYSPGSPSNLAGSKSGRFAGEQGGRPKGIRAGGGLASKQLLMIPARVALALQADGWWLRSKIVWHKPNPMPESVRDRPTAAYEEVFLFAKSPRYFYDAGGVAEKATGRDPGNKGHAYGFMGGTKAGLHKIGPAETRNLRNVWTIAPKPFRGAHFAVMPIDLADRCIRAGSRPGDTILDPFAGAGTTALAAYGLNRNALMIEINPEYARIAEARLPSLRWADAAD